MTSIEVLGKLPELPEAPPPIVALPAPRISEKTLLGVAAMLKMKASEEHGSILRDALTFRYTEGPLELAYHRASGGFRFKDKSRWQFDHGGNVELSDEEAVKLARTQLRRYDLLPDDAKVLKVSRLHVAVSGQDRKMQDHRVIDVAVCFQPVVNGVPLDGPGGKVIVYLDHEGKMTGLDHIVRRRGPVFRKATGLHPPERAVEEARRIWTARGVPNAQINEVRFCYFELGWNDEQKYLQPAYLILATLFGRDERVRMGDVVVTPAAVNSPEAIVPPPKRPKPQKPRGGERRG